MNLVVDDGNGNEAKVRFDPEEAERVKRAVVLWAVVPLAVGVTIFLMKDQQQRAVEKALEAVGVTPTK